MSIESRITKLETAVAEPTREHLLGQAEKLQQYIESNEAARRTNQLRRQLCPGFARMMDKMKLRLSN